MDTNSTSQTKNENEGQTGCEACIKKDEIITALYEALKDVLNMRTIVDSYEKDRALKALAKADGK